VLVMGPLAPFAEDYRRELRGRGYAERSAVSQLRQVARFSCWLEAGQVSVSELGAGRVEEFLGWQRAVGRHRSQWSRPGLVCLLEVLGELGVLAAGEPVGAGSPAAVLLAGFGRYLAAERGLAAGTVRSYVDHARRFLAGLPAGTGLAGVCAKDVTEAVLRKSAAVSVSAAQFFVAGLRSFLRFCFVEREMPVDLSQAALPVTGRRRSALPRGIAKADARALLGGCDRRSALGRRDYAMLVTLLRLGLRAGEVARLRLDDIDWRAGELVVRGKGARQDRLAPARRGGPGDRLLPAPGTAGQQPAGGVLAGTGPVRPDSGGHRVIHGAPGVPAGKGGGGGRAPPAPHGGLRDGGRRSPAGRHRPGAAPPQPADHRRVRAGGPGPAAGPGRTVAGKRAAMSALTGHVEDYLRLRRALGFKLERAGQLLPPLAAYLEAAGAGTVTSDLAIAWARLPQATPNHWAQRLAIARGFARYLQTIDPAAEVPPPGVFPARRHRPSPYLFCQRDICRVLEAARALRPPLRAATCEAIFGLIAASGMRIGEAIGLDDGDVDLDAGVITIREAKFGRSRLVPLHPTVTQALGRYAAERGRLCPRPRPAAFFLSRAGTRLDRSGVGATFRKTTADLGIRTAAVRPRVHDLRHSFAVQTLIRWQRAGLNVDERIGALSAYLGHVAPADTYWYLSASPELMSLAAGRLAEMEAPR